MAIKFQIDFADGGTFDSTKVKNVEHIVKFLCGKGMIDPVDDSPVEADTVRPWR